MSLSERIDTVNALVDAGDPDPQGCSGFVCKVLGINWQDAESIMNGSTVAVLNDLSNLVPGDIVGWTLEQCTTPSAHAHVAVFTQTPKPFADVRSPGQAPRRLSSYGSQPLFKCSNY
jgi:hypothetical protein